MTPIFDFMEMGGLASSAGVASCSAETGGEEVARITHEVIAAGIPGARLGIHTHDDTGNAVACTLAAVDAGADARLSSCLIAMTGVV